jgi:hypothetical protein
LTGWGVNAEFDRIGWLGEGDTPFRPGVEYNLGAAFRRVDVVPLTSPDKPQVEGWDASSRLALWAGFVSVGVMGQYESITSGIENDTTKANQRRLLYGPTIGIANNGNAGFRVSATGYLMRRQGSAGGAGSERVRGISAELALGLYFARADLRSMQFDVPVLGRSFNHQISLGGGFRVP